MEAIRQFFVTHPTQARDMLLSERQAHVVQAARLRPATSASVAKRYDCSVQAASSLLEKCRAKGYLTRTQKIDPTGGIYFEYSYCTLTR